MMKVKDCVEMPEKKKIPEREFDCGRDEYEQGFNQALDQFSSLPISEDKLREQGWIKKTDLIFCGTLAGSEEFDTAVKKYGYTKLDELEIDKEIYINIASDISDKTFPKGECKERGALLVFIALLLIALSQSLPKLLKGKDTP